MADARCQEPSGWDGWRTHPCGNRGKVEKDGKWYCGVHDPDKVAAKAKARQKKYEASVEASRRSTALAAAKRAVVETGLAWEATVTTNPDSGSFGFADPDAFYAASRKHRAALRELARLRGETP